MKIADQLYDRFSGASHFFKFFFFWFRVITKKLKITSSGMALLIYLYKYIFMFLYVHVCDIVSMCVYSTKNTVRIYPPPLPPSSITDASNIRKHTAFHISHATPPYIPQLIGPHSRAPGRRRWGGIGKGGREKGGRHKHEPIVTRNRSHILS